MLPTALLLLVPSILVGQFSTDHAFSILEARRSHVKQRKAPFAYDGMLVGKVVPVGPDLRSLPNSTALVSTADDSWSVHFLSNYLLMKCVWDEGMGFEEKMIHFSAIRGFASRACVDLDVSRLPPMEQAAFRGEEEESAEEL